VFQVYVGLGERIMEEATISEMRTLHESARVLFYGGIQLADVEVVSIEKQPADDGISMLQAE
jgi:hypothetical protein